MIRRPLSAVCASHQVRFFGDSPSRVRPREVKRQGLRRATEIELSGTVMLVFLFVIPAFLVTSWGPGFMRQKERDQQWALNLGRDREAGLPRYWDRASHEDAEDRSLK